MTEHRIEPHKVTKPIQLLAAWLVGLILTNGIFLSAALHLEPNTWERGALVVASIINVPIFLLALFILQTRFRAELQEDTYYSEYLSKKTAAVVRIDKNASQDARIELLEAKILNFAKNEVQKEPSITDELDWTDWSIGLNDLHPKFDQIRKALKEAHIPLKEIFGSTSIRPETPKKWLIAISHHLPISHKIKLLKILISFDFDGFQLWEPLIEAEEFEDAYIGSYDISSYASITPELEKLLESDIETADLQRYYRLHTKHIQNTYG